MSSFGADVAVKTTNPLADGRVCSNSKAFACDSLVNRNVGSGVRSERLSVNVMPRTCITQPFQLIGGVRQRAGS